MREGEDHQCSECGAPIPPGRGKLAFTCSTLCRRRRDSRLRRERMGQTSGRGTPSPPPRGAPPIRRSIAESTAERSFSQARGKRPPPTPEPPADPPLPINDPTVLDRAFAEARALLALEHVEAVTVRRDGVLTVLRVGAPGESVVDVLQGLGEIQGVAQHAELDFGGAR